MKRAILAILCALFASAVSAQKGDGMSTPNDPMLDFFQEKYCNIPLRDSSIVIVIPDRLSPPVPEDDSINRVKYNTLFPEYALPPGNDNSHIIPISNYLKRDRPGMRYTGGVRYASAETAREFDADSVVMFDIYSDIPLKYRMPLNMGEKWLKRYSHFTGIYLTKKGYHYIPAFIFSTDEGFARRDEFTDFLKDDGRLENIWDTPLDVKWMHLPDYYSLFPLPDEFAYIYRYYTFETIPSDQYTNVFGPINLYIMSMDRQALVLTEGRTSKLAEQPPVKPSSPVKPNSRLYKGVTPEPAPLEVIARTRRINALLWSTDLKFSKRKKFTDPDAEANIRYMDEAQAREMFGVRKALVYNLPVPPEKRSKALDKYIARLIERGDERDPLTGGGVETFFCYDMDNEDMGISMGGKLGFEEYTHCKALIVNDGRMYRELFFFFTDQAWPHAWDYISQWSGYVRLEE